MRLLVPAILIAPLTLVLPAFPQALTEHAAAVAGASVGTGAGKSIGESLTKVFGDVDDTAVKASAQNKKPAELKKDDKRDVTAAPVVATGPRGGMPLSASSGSPAAESSASHP